VIGESHFSVEIIADDETAKTFVKESHMSAQREKSLSDSILSVNVSGVKPR